MVEQRRYGPWLEEEILKFWYEHKIHNRMFQHRSHGKEFYFLDGPPYTSGYIHLGTAWNKILKDVIIKYLTFKGYYVRAQPGWDMHGLPIEVLTEKKLKFKTKKDIERFGIDKFIEECKKLALKNLSIMEEQFKRLGVFMNWESPYRTIDPEYIESEWFAFKKAWELGLISRDFKVVHWCPRCETALAEHEIEYRELVDPSIYVKLPIANKKDEYILIWTTTPWTLPANLAVLAHPDLKYAKVEVRVNGHIEYYWLLEERVQPVVGEIGIKEYRIVELRKGSELDGIKYNYPLAEEMPLQREFDSKYMRAHTIVMGEFVRTTEGTGFVHIAPGHGQEDWQVGKTYNIPIYCPVDEEGKFTEGIWKGIFVKDADKLIIERLREKGLLVFSGTIKHRYPTCWRCKSALLFRATKQMFLTVSKIKNRIIEGDEKFVEWYPEWVRKRYRDGLASVGDWVISRQRYWNAPIPLWVCEKCGHEVVIGSFDELRELAASKLPDKIDPHRPFIDTVILRCPKCGGNMRRVPDVLDVWFDSAVCAWASMHYPKRKDEFERFFPANLIIEGQDQVMKWFYAQQVLGTIVFNRPPYNKVVMHGFVLDAAGAKMSKSLGNIVMPEEVIKKYGADTLRFYLTTTVSPWEDIRFNWDDVKEVNSILDILWNVYIMAKTYMELDKFNPKHYNDKFFEKYAQEEDKWILSRTNSLISSVEQELERFNFARAGRLILNYIAEDLSRWYGKIIRWRLWIEKDDPVKNVAYYTLFNVFIKVLPLLALYAPFIAEYIYLNLLRKLDGSLPESVFLLDWPKIDYVNKELEEKMEVVREIVSAVGAARTQVGIKARWPVKMIIVDSSVPIVHETIKGLRTLLLQQANAKDIIIKQLEKDYEVSPKVKNIGKKYKSLTPMIVDFLNKTDPKVIVQTLRTEGKYSFQIHGNEVIIEPDDLEVNLKQHEGLSIVEFKYGHLAITTELDEELLAEGLAKDVVRRIQQMRKEMSLNIEDFIKVYINAPEDFLTLIKRHLNYIMNETRATEIVFGEPVGFVKEWDIEDYSVKIGVEKVQQK
ncbi:MAG: isoleucine--tRNA ligase [Crenarchaeota archaeon]|nr:isoleucine--tRNA ligase [Thermoproteota archaeon]MCR8500808.1 isoleucine--tRNA ligase [Thermoproteota archaeon]